MSLGRFFFSLSILIFLFMETFAYAQTGSTSSAWYNVAYGIIMVPAAFVGLIVSLNMIRKTTLESRKLELEIRQKQSEFTESKDVASSVKQLASPVADSQRALLLILRFVILELAITFWKVVPAAIGYITKPIPYLLYFTLGSDFFENFNPLSPTTLALSGAAILFGLMLDIVYWVIVFGFGWPLLKDTCSLLGISITELFNVPFLGRRNTVPGKS